MKKTLVCSLLAALCVPAHALAGTWAVGAGPGGIGLLRAQLPGARTLVPGRALVVHGPRPHVRGASYVVRLDGVTRSLASDSRVAFDNAAPLADKQWYLEQDHAWDHWLDLPNLTPVRVAVIDSGIDYTHPEFVGQVAAGISFVGGSWKHDTDGHGTFVAGEIAANQFNAVGIAGLAFNAKLLIAKVVDDPTGRVSLVGEIDAIRWAVNHGARVINLSIGGPRDPLDPELDTFSPPERDAVEYAYSRGVVVVAAVGNGTESPRTPWSFADYPAALPHVIGVAALRQDGGVPDYSNRDTEFVDIAAPGGPIFSTIPRNLIDATRPDCVHSPYSDCGPFEFQNGIGTSFAAPQVSSAAALLLGENPDLKPDQVAWLLERTALDVNAADGCRHCVAGRDSLTGWGRLNIAAALSAASNGRNLPPTDAYEPNDDAGSCSHILAYSCAPAFGPPRTISATLDYWDDPIDVYSVTLAQGQQLFARLTRLTNAPTTLVLWKPGTLHVDKAHVVKTDRATESTSVGGQQRLGYRAPASGVYYLEVKINAPTRSVDVYRLALATRR